MRILPIKKRSKAWPPSFLVTASLLFASISLSLASNSVVNFSADLLDRVSTKWGSQATQRLTSMETMIKNNQNLNDLEKLALVNQFFNLVPYKSDINHWGKKDYWATPFEMLTTFGADCEDYSIAKYFVLRELGVPDEYLKITYVKALNWDEAHMVLTYSKSATQIPMVLDNLNPEILPADQRTDLVPVYSFNAEGLWLSKERGNGQYVGSSDRIGMWVEMLNRLNQ